MSEHPPTQERDEPARLRLSTRDILEIKGALPAVLSGSEAALQEYVDQRNSPAGQEMARLALEEVVQAKFAHLSTEALMNRMNRAPDFGYDDEEVEMTRRARLMGLAWRWTGDFFRPSVELYKPEDRE